MVEVNSFQLSDEQIIDALVKKFNTAYATLGFEATREIPRLDLAFEDIPGLIIPDLPCPLGIRAGCRDTGLKSRVGYALY